MNILLLTKIMIKKIKYILLIVGFYSITLSAQNTLKFNKRYIDCEDKWVAFKMNKDSSYSFGFIYIDTQAGLTLNWKGNFFIAANGTFIPPKMDTTSIKYKLEYSTNRVAVIPKEKLLELKIPEFPAWLKNYKTDTTSVERLFRIGLIYNIWNENVKAFSFLERAKLINPKFPGLETELGYAYNGLEMYDDALISLENALKYDTDSGSIYKEISYAQVHKDELEKAVSTSKKAIEYCKDNDLKGEIAFNMAQGYYKRKDKNNFKVWAKETKKWVSKDDEYSTTIDKMEKDLSN
jgi:tetratricopeptide (TPR) repeat protein